VDVRDLDYFLACCKAGSFTAAAREVHIVQSAMSCAIARLEADLGVSLFDRTVTPITLTEHGAALQPVAQRILDDVKAARDVVAAVSGQVRGTVALGATLHTGPLDLVRVLTDVRERHPDVIVKLRQSKSGSDGKAQAVHDGSVDIALLASPSESEPPRGVTLHPLVNEPLVFVCRPDHPLSQRSRVAVPDLHGEMILRFPPGWGTRTVVDAVLGATDSAFEVADLMLMVKLVRAGFATTLLPASAVSSETVRGLRAVRIDDARLRWSLFAAISTDRRLTGAATMVLNALTQRSRLCGSAAVSS
jgi:DNA-binding transcriptional LysR family regulator